MLRKLALIIIFLFAFQLFAQEVYSLKECIEYALSNNIRIQQGGLDIRLKKYDLDQRVAGRYPSLNGSIGQNFSFGNSLDETTYNFVKSNNSNYFHIGSDLTLFNGFRMQNNIKSGRYLYDASEQALKDIKDQISLNIASTYLQILMNFEQIEYAEKQLSLTKKLHEQAKVLVEVGEETKSKELELNAQQANDEVALVEAQNQLEQSYLVLKEMLNWDVSKKLEIEKIDVDSGHLTDYSDYNLDESITEHISNQPGIKKAKLEYQGAIYAYQSSVGNKYPSLKLQASVDTRYSSAADFQGAYPFSEQIDKNFGQSLGFGLSIPIFNNLRTTFSIQSAQINMLNSKLNLKSIEISVRNTIFEAFYIMQNANKKYLASENSLKAQQLLFEQSDLMYEEGMISFYDWQNTKNSLAKSESSFVSAKYDYLFRIKAFEYYIGKEINL